MYIRADGAGPRRGSPPFPKIYFEQRYILSKDIFRARRARAGSRTPVGRPWGLGGRWGAPRRAPSGPFWTHPNLLDTPKLAVAGVWTHPNWPVGGALFWTHPKLTSWRGARSPAAFVRPPAPACALQRPPAVEAPPEGRRGAQGRWRGGRAGGVGSGLEGRSREMGRILTKSVRCTLRDQKGGPLCMGKKSCTDHLHS
jgi:hypothetical protein